MSTTQKADRKVLLQKPALENAPEIYKLVCECKPLDRNSEYLYMLLCAHFHETCVVAHLNSKAVGAATGYLTPDSPETLFIWQIAVAPEVRQLGLAQTMLNHLLRRRACREVRFIEATIAPSNEASMRLFESWAEELDAAFKYTPFFEQKLFTSEQHEEERLIRIGPLKRGK